MEKEKLMEIGEYTDFFALDKKESDKFIRLFHFLQDLFLKNLSILLIE